MDNSGRKVDFGFEQVARGDKAERVRSVFASVAGKYDVMNDLMSFGAHRLWKHFTLSLTGLRPGQRALDVAGGTGDLSLGMLRQVGRSGCVVLSDVNPAMLEIGRDRLLDKGWVGNAECIVADAERLPFADGSFDCAIYDAYSFKVLPLLGRLVARDEASYRYLAESIRMHPNQETLLDMLRTAGFAQTRYHNLTGGIVAVHRGYKI